MKRISALLIAASLGGLFDRPDPNVEAANKAYAKGEYDKALRGYEDAQLRLPDDPRLAYDRGNALYKLGRRDEARAAYLTALGAHEDSLKTQDWFNLGNALWDLGKKDEAAQAYQRALLLDPTFDDARHNLELLLQPPPPQDAGSPDGGRDGGEQGDGGKQPSSPDGGKGDAGGGDGGAGDGGSKGQGKQQGGEDGGQEDGGAQQPQPQDQDGGAQAQPLAQRDGGAGDEHNQQQAQAQPLNEQQAQQLLDALRQREKNFQLWKFRIKHQHAQNVEKDW
ncbi:MAG TPA: tetratricopeptide repeat protein [Myxococcales bacterium]|nr:tetratricopeptide repeat protein [Myxococcales bacterium]